jgi:NAD(P)-dependent dehydrogenase (short-subunit alcohol dehydrogenase family)
MDRMKDKFVVVTGAAHGIGAAIAQRFAEEGAALALLDLDGALLAETAKRATARDQSAVVSTRRVVRRRNRCNKRRFDVDAQASGLLGR